MDSSSSPVIRRDSLELIKVFNADVAVNRRTDTWYPFVSECAMVFTQKAKYLAPSDSTINANVPLAARRASRSLELETQDGQYNP